jgi:hypothetical protein
MAGRHGTSTRAVNSLEAESLTTEGKYGRLFPTLPVAVYGPDQGKEFLGSQAALIELAKTMLKDDAGKPIGENEPEDENVAIPSGYTYLGQFIDHDISFDPSAISDRVIDPTALTDFRTPRLDLDCLYGRGPDDQPYLYQHPDYGAFHVGNDVAPPNLNKPRHDLVRNSDGRAIIGDPRNNENKLVTQIHALMLDFHNTVWAQTPQGPDRFHNTRQSVRWHYQWIVVHDFLHRLLDPDVWQRYFGNGKPKLSFYKIPKFGPFIPVEFAAAAYRLGHSMVRPSYALNKTVTEVEGSPRVPIFKRGAPANEQLNGFERVPDQWGLDWGFFFPNINSTQFQPAGAPKFFVPQPSYRLDSVLVMPLGDLPDHNSSVDWKRSLPALNLVRSRLLGLPSGQDVHAYLNIVGPDLGPVLTEDQLWNDQGNVPPEQLEARRALPNRFPLFKKAAPLWYYILREAELLSSDEHGGGVHLGPVGSTIVAETFAALLLADTKSYLNAEGWTPTLPGRNEGDFTMSDLINFVDANAQTGFPAKAGIQ